MSETKKVWNAEGKNLYLSHPSEEFEELENAIYKVGIDGFGRFFLTKVNDSFDFPYKIYGLESELIDRVIRTFNNTTSNLGILLNGLKGTGKTVSSKIIANNLNQPIILVTFEKDGIVGFLNSISQNVTIFVDEYEKIFGDSSSLLTIMDGAMNSEFRRVFLLTTNKLYVDDNLIQRPGRIRYLKKFENLSPQIVEEIIDDILINKTNKSECISFISNLETITVDIVKAVIEECNIHNETPSKFENIFNVKKLKGKYNVLLKDTDGSLSKIAESVVIHPHPNYNDNYLGYNFSIDNKTIGNITRVINWTTIEVSPFKNGRNKSVGFDNPIIIKIEDADIVNYAYSYGDYNYPSVSNRTKTLSRFAENVIQAIDKCYEEEELEEDIASELIDFVNDESESSGG